MGGRNSGGHNKLGDRSAEIQESVEAVIVHEYQWLWKPDPNKWTERKIFLTIARSLYRDGITKHQLASSAVSRLAMNHYSLMNCKIAIRDADPGTEPKFAGKCAFTQFNFFAKQISDTLKDLGVKPEGLTRSTVAKSVVSESYEIED